MGKWTMLAVGIFVSGAVLAAVTGGASAGEPEPVSEPKISLELPAAVEHTKLVIREMAAYEGPFWEDGTGEEVADVAALVVENVGGVMISKAEITLQTDRGPLEFSVSWLPADGILLVPEKNRASAGPYQIFACAGWNTTLYPEMSGAVTAREEGLGALVFTNHTTQLITKAEAVYKAYDPDSGMYIGGSAGCVELRKLESEEERRIVPDRYACGYTRVVCILLSAEE